MEIMDKIYRVKRSHRDNKKLVSFTDEGKIILVTNQDDVHAGYGKIINYKEYDKYILAEMGNVVCDFYNSYDKETWPEDTISLAELDWVLQDKGFVLEYEELIERNCEMLVYANLDTGALVVIETFMRENNIKVYNKVDVYVSGNGKPPRINRFLGLSSGNGAINTYNIVHCSVDFPLQTILNTSTNSTDWKGNHPMLWNYSEKMDRPEDFKNAISKIFKFKHPIHKLFNMDVEGFINNIDKESDN